MPAGGYLRTNYRTTGGQIDLTVIGGGKQYGSAAGGAGWAVMGRFWGGFVANSISGVNSIFSIGPLTDIIYSWCGAGFDSGYKVVPLGILIQRLNSVGATFPVGLNWSLTDSTGSIICVYPHQGSISTVESSVSAAFILAGFICSTPD